MKEKQSLMKLAEHSEYAKEMLDVNDNPLLVTIFDSSNFPLEELTFHPNGKCGCVQLDDEYMFGIRCNYLMWAEGSVEGTELFWKKIKKRIGFEIKNREPFFRNCIMIYGNHKGGMIMKLLVFSRYIPEGDD